VYKNYLNDLRKSRNPAEAGPGYSGEGSIDVDISIPIIGSNITLR
jgi:hypothetical protein